MNIVLLIVIQVAIIGMAVVILFFSDRTIGYRILSLLALVPMAVLEVPHLLYPDPTDLIDIFTHFTAGIALFLTASNLRTLNREVREWISVLVGIIAILGSEALLSVIGGSISLDSVEDIIWNSIGSAVGMPLFWIFGKRLSAGIDGDPATYCKCN